MNGHRIPMHPGDLVLTPNWTWHDHANDTDAPMIWLDGLDTPLVRMLEGEFYEEYHTEPQAVGAGVDPPPQWHYPMSQARAALERLAAERGGSPANPIVLDYTNPATGGPTMPTIACQIQLLRPGEHTQAQVVPSASRIAVLVNPDVPILVRQVKDVQVAASALDMRIVPLEVREPDDIDRAFRTMSLERVHALDVLGGAAGIHRKRVAALAIKSRIPTISTTREFAGDGGLISYGASFEDLYRRAATFVDKILKGAKPADLPVEQPTKFELVINLKTAKALGLTIPPGVLGRADEVIE